MIHKILICTGILGFCFFMLLSTKPNNDQYINFLNEKHGIICESPEELYDCVQIRDEERVYLSWRAKSENDVGIFVIIKDTYKSENGDVITISTLGILGMLINLDY